MNRVVKFRGQRLDNGEWIYGQLAYSFGDTERPAIMPSCFFVTRDFGEEKLEGCMAFGGFYRVIPETVGQFTGLFDKTGKEIYEGDICDCWTNLSQDAGNFINEVIYKDGAFGYSDGCNFHSFANHSGISKPIINDWQVIGNIHQNPELCQNS